MLNLLTWEIILHITHPNMFSLLKATAIHTRIQIAQVLTTLLLNSNSSSSHLPRTIQFSNNSNSLITSLSLNSDER